MVSVAYGDRVGRKIPPVKTLVGIELKISDIVGVLKQCENLKWWCHAVYAAMPSEAVDRMKAETKTRFQLLGIGLLSVESKKVYTEITPSRPCYPTGDNVEALRTRLWRRIKSGKTHITDEERHRLNARMAESHEYDCSCKYCLPTREQRMAENEKYLKLLVAQGEKMGKPG